MDEEEKEAINNLRFYSTNVGFSKYDGTTCVLRAKDVQIVLNLIGKQYAELNNLKEIEKSHQKENGKLKVEFEKVYEDNLTLANELEQYKLLEANIDKANKIIAENKFDEGLYGLLMQEKEKNNNLIKQLQEQNAEIQDISRQLRQEKEKNKELNEALERSSCRVTELTVENSDLKYQIYHKQQIIDELTQNEEKLKIELGKEKEKTPETLRKQLELYQDKLYEEKEKNKELETDNIDLKEKNRLIAENLSRSYISKDKIKELLENETIDISGFRCIAVEDIEELLEEN